MINLLSKTKDELLGKAKATLDTINPSNTSSSSSPNTSPDLPGTIQEPSALDILRYRYHHGTNLGSIYVLERWLFPSRFVEGSQGSSELESVKTWTETIGAEATKALFEKAWANTVSDEDIKWLKEDAKCTTIRLPIGYFDLPDTSYTSGTPFEPYSYIYSAAWASIITLISRLRVHSIGVIIDFHALPGGANPQDHSGTNRGAAQFFSTQSNRDLGVRCCEFVARESKSGLPIVGLELVNEADWESPNMYEWYDECIEKISAIDATLPLYISDAWNLSKAVEYSLAKNCAYASKPTCPVIADTHLYWAFTDDDKKKSPEQIIKEVSTKLSALDGREGSIIDRGAVQTVVGEYSCVLTEDSWAKSSASERENLVQQFGAAQSKCYQNRTAGSFFWTWKMDWMPGGEWGFTAQSNPNSRCILPPQHALIPAHNMGKLLERAEYRRDERMYGAVNQHISYWQHIHANKPAEHWRFENGWKVGYNDALVFFQGKEREAVQQGNKIGALELWVLKRVRECGFRGNFVWEYEHGVRRGIHDFNATVGI